MSDRQSEREFHQKCDACDFQKLKQLENNPVIRKLRDKIEQLNFRLSECRNENQMLKRNLQLAKKTVCQEVGQEDIDFQNMIMYGTEAGSKDRRENVLVLKNKVEELKDYLRELEGASPVPQETPSEEFDTHQLRNDRKKLWRTELERRLARKNAEKDINPLVQECFELRRNLDAEKTRFRELSQEVKLLRAELQSQVEKNEEDYGILKSFETLEKQLEETLAERADIRQNLNGSRARNKRLVEELMIVKEELESLQKKTNDNNVLIDSLTSSHKSIQEAIDAEKLIVQQNIERYEEDLKTLQENYTTDSEILDHVKCIIYDRNSLIDDLRKDVDSGGTRSGEEEAASDDTEKLSSESIILRPSPSKSNMPKEDASSVEDQLDDKNQLNSELKIRKLRLECAKYKALCEACRMESHCLSQLIDNQDRKMNEAAVQVIETGRLIMQNNAEKKELLDKVNKLQLSFSAKNRKGKLQPKSRSEELRTKNDVRKGENEYLRNFLYSTACSKAKDLQEIKGFITDNKQFFESCFHRIKELLESNILVQENDNVATESPNEINP